MTTELLIYGAALVMLLFAIRTGAKSGAAAALSWMLGSVLSLLITLRYWFLLCRAAAAVETASLPLLATLCFWMLFIAILAVFLKLRATFIDEYEALTVSFIGRLLGGIFGAVSGAVFVSALILSASLLSPELFPADKANPQPIALDTAPTMAFRYLEAKVAGVDAQDAAHTRLPKGRNAGQTPATFWQ